MNINKRLEKIEQTINTNNKRFLFLFVSKGETQESVLNLALEKNSLTIDDVGYVTYMSDDGIYSYDYNNHNGLETLNGLREHQQMLREIIANIDGTSLGPPNLRKNR